jgi:hypothetical protein
VGIRNDEIKALLWMSKYLERFDCGGFDVWARIKPDQQPRAYQRFQMRRKLSSYLLRDHFHQFYGGLTDSHVSIFDEVVELSGPPVKKRCLVPDIDMEKDCRCSEPLQESILFIFRELLNDFLELIKAFDRRMGQIVRKNRQIQTTNGRIGGKPKAKKSTAG